MGNCCSTEHARLQDEYIFDQDTNSVMLDKSMASAPHLPHTPTTVSGMRRIANYKSQTSQSCPNDSPIITPTVFDDLTLNKLGSSNDNREQFTNVPKTSTGVPNTSEDVKQIIGSALAAIILLPKGDAIECMLSVDTAGYKLVLRHENDFIEISTKDVNRVLSTTDELSRIGMKRECLSVGEWFGLLLNENRPHTTEPVKGDIGTGGIGTGNSTIVSTRCLCLQLQDSSLTTFFVSLLKEELAKAEQ